MSVRVAARPWAAVCRGALVHHRRHISGGGRGDLFVRHASAYRTSLYGVRRGLTDSSQATDHHSGQLHARKRVEHTIGDRASSGNGLHRAAIAAWSYLLPSLRQSVETALPITVFDKLRTGEAPLTPSEAQQLTDAQRILRFELRQRIALLEDSLAEAELPYLLQWPMLFERAWIRLPVGACHAPPPPTQTAQSSSVDSSALSTAATPAPHSVAQWASSARPTAAPSNDGGGRLVPRVSQLTQHVMRAVEEDLRLLKSDSLRRLLETEAPLQQRMLCGVSSYIDRHENPDALFNGASATVPMSSAPEGLPSVRCAGSHGASAPPQPPAPPLVMSLTVDLFEVAQRHPHLGEAVLSLQSAALDTAASAAAASWLSGHAHSRREGRLRGTASRVWTALLHQQLTCRVHLVVLRIPGLYTTVTSATAAASTAPHGARECRRTRHSRGAYPADRFLEASQTVDVLGVVHRVCYERHSAALPAPWVTLLLLPRGAATPTCLARAAGDRAPRRVQVDLSSLADSERAAVAVIGGVVQVRGHTRVARCRTDGRAGGVRAEALLQECIVASWAAPVLGTSAAPSAHDSGVCGSGHEDGVGAPQSVGGTPPRAAPPTAEPSLGAGPSLTPAEEEAAARAALVCWEGTRLALGVEPAAAGPADGDGRPCLVAPLFSVSLDFIVASQLALVSAQMADGVVVLAMDEAVPESLLTRLLRRLDESAPGAALEVPASAVARARPSLFLPSYHTQRLSRLALARTSAPATAAEGTPMGPPGVQAAVRPRVGPASVVAAPAPPCYPEVFEGGTLTHASGRTLVLQRLEALPLPTLKFLQEALRDDTGDTAAPTSAACNGVDNDGAAPQPLDGMSSATEAAATATRRVIQREGGQAVRYRTTHSALCSVRRGAAMTQRGPLVEFAERCDVVLRPAYDTHRQASALQGSSTAPAFCHLLHTRAEAWLELLGAALALPGETHLEVDCPPIARSAADRVPTLSDACSQLLSTYFIAAKALCLESADASMMKTLVKLTLAHAEWRTRLTTAWQASAGHHVAAASATATVTALVDAVAAVGLCDATLHFFTATTLLGECVFRLLEVEAWPPVAGHDTHTSAVRADSEGGVAGWEPLFWDLERRTSLAVPATHSTEPQPPSLPSASICQVVQDLQTHLECTVRQSHHSAAAVPTTATMFGRPQAPQKEWGNMYFYEKLHHLIDHTSDFVISKVNWWLPSVATGMALSLFLLGGPEALPQAASIVLPSVTPAITTPPFAMAEGQHGGGGATEDEEEF